jgi:hypothetical protein
MSRAYLYAGVLLALAVLVLVGSLTSGLAPGGAGRRLGGLPDGGGDRIRVEVLNAVGISGLARAATDRLRSAGYDVVYYGNADSFGQDTSIVLDRIGDAGAARAVARAVGIDAVDASLDSTLFLDVTVILGNDWSGIPPRADSAGARPPG